VSLRSVMERHLNAIWYGGDRRPPLAYRGLAALHRRLGRANARRPAARPAVPVVVVGNLCAGGSGKTPVVMAIARALANDRRVAVISRGYGGRAGRYPLAVEADTPVGACGDEALLIRLATGLPVFVDPVRSRALQQAIRAADAEIVVSDDGLQHRGLPRSFEVCLFDGRRGVGNGRLLPAGPLRQPLSRLNEVDQILIKGQGMDWPGAERFELEVIGLRPLGEWQARGAPQGPPGQFLEAWRGRAVSAVCGLADPGQFKDMLERQGLRVHLRVFPDHHRYRPADLEGLAGPVLTTAKDAVKLGAWAEQLDIRVLEVEARLPENFLQRIGRHIEGFEP